MTEPIMLAVSWKDGDIESAMRAIRMICDKFPDRLELWDKLEMNYQRERIAREIAGLEKEIKTLTEALNSIKRVCKLSPMPVTSCAEAVKIADDALQKLKGPRQ